MRQTDAICGIHRFDERQKSGDPNTGVSYFMVEGDSVLGLSRGLLYRLNCLEVLTRLLQNSLKALVTHAFGCRVCRAQLRDFDTGLPLHEWRMTPRALRLLKDRNPPRSAVRAAYQRRDRASRQGSLHGSFHNRTWLSALVERVFGVDHRDYPVSV